MALIGAWLNKETKGNLKDYSNSGNDATATNITYEKIGASFAGGNFTYTSTVFSTQSYLIYESDGWNWYVDNGTSKWKNNVSSSTIPLIFTSTGFTNQTVRIKDVRLYSDVKDASWVAKEYAKMFPESDLVLHTLVTDANDLSGNDNNCTPIGDIAVGKGFSGGGNGKYLQFPDLGIFAGTTSYSIAVSINASSLSGSKTIIHPRHEKDVLLWVVGNNLQFAFYDGTLKPASYTIEANKEYRVLAVWDVADSLMKLYVNGTLVASRATGTPNTTTDINMIGLQTLALNRPFLGTIKNLKIYNTAKDAAFALKDYEENKRYF